MKFARPLPEAALPVAIVAIISMACSSGDSFSTATPPADADTDAATTLKSSDEFPASLSESERWVDDRLEAAQGIWGFTPAGVAWQNSYDFRQMRGQPAWFGSTGSKGWAGAGQAIPRSVLHELGHSYWGAFPVDGRPDLSTTEGVEELLEAYGADLLAFMRQPPDRFEPLRDRFRNLPNLDRGELTDLIHFGESELVYFTGGDLDLIPPILRKYYRPYLTPDGVAGDVEDWAGVLGWWFGLDDDGRADAGEVIGLQHFPLATYSELPRDNDSALDAAITAVLDAEERQRLIDFAGQFDEIKSVRSSLADATGTDRGFNFWERYLREMADLHAEHPDVLGTRTGDRGEGLGAAFDAYRDMADLSPEAQAERDRTLAASAIGPNIRDFAPLLKARTLLILFPNGSDPATEGIEASAGAYAAELRELVAIADAALSEAAADPEGAAVRLAASLDEFDDDRLAGSIDTVFNTMREADRDTSSEIISNLPDPFLLRLLEVRPSAARTNEVTPEKLLQAAGVVPGASADSLIAGTARLAENSSGNFAIDAPFDEAVYDILDDLAVDSPGLVLRVFQETELRPMPWVAGHGDSAARVFRTDPAASLELLAGYKGAEPTAARVLRALAYSDPDASALLIKEAFDSGRVGIVTGALNSIVYDAYWTGLGVTGDRRIESARDLLVSLRDLLGPDQIMELIVEAVAEYLADVQEDELEAEYRSRHLETLQVLETGAETDSDRAFFRSLSASVRSASL